MNLSSWLRAVARRIQKSSASKRGTADTIQLGLMRLEDRQVLSAAGGEVMLFSVGAAGATLPGLGQVQAADVISYDGSQFEILFDGSNIPGLEGANIDALAVLGDSQFLFSFAGSTTIAGVTYQPQDVVLFEATALGEDTAGSFSLFLRGADLGLPPIPAGNIDAIDVLEDGSLIFSLEGRWNSPFGQIDDSDLIQLTPDANGNLATGTMRLYFDGGQVGLSNDVEDVNAVSISGSVFQLSTSGGFFANAQTNGSKEDVFKFTASSTGAITSGTYGGLTFDGNVVTGKTFDLNALDFATFTVPPTNHPPTAEDVSAKLTEDGSVLVQLLGDDGELDQDQALTYQIVEGPDFGQISNFDAATGTFTYTPNADYSGTDTLTYLVRETDDNGNVLTSQLASVHLTITEVNDAPTVAIAQPKITAEAGEPILIQGIAVGDPEAATQQTWVSVTLQTEQGTLSVPNEPLSILPLDLNLESDDSSAVTIVGNGTNTVTLTGTVGDINQILSQGVAFQPSEGFAGQASVNITIEDSLDPGSALSGSGSVQIEVMMTQEQAQDPATALRERIHELVQSGELKHHQGKVLFNAVNQAEQFGHLAPAIHQLQNWVRTERLDVGLAQELAGLFQDVAESADPHGHGHQWGHHHSFSDAMFSHFGQGKGHNGRFHC